jgi:hypothetical protein
MDRVLQRTRNYTGILGVPTQDRTMTEGMGPIMDRTQEHLGTSDLAIVALRSRLPSLVRDLECGIEPTAPSNGDVYRVRSPDSISSETDFRRFLRQQGLRA